MADMEEFRSYLIFMILTGTRMTYLSRNKVYEKIEPNKEAKKVYIICEGQEKEYRYFRYFKGFSSNIDIVPIPSENGQSDPIKLKEQAQLLFFGDEQSQYTIASKAMACH